MYRYEDIRRVHLEVTSKCNARCPQCPRNLSGGRTNPNLPLTDLSLADIRAIFSPAFVAQLNDIDLCGNYGDASASRDLLESTQYLRSQNPKLIVRLHTNGSARTPQWWRELAGSVQWCIFAIDGLEDTNALYRRGTAWKNIIANATAFMEAGGGAEWTFIVFRHNEHQIDEAAALAKELGFAKFTYKKSARFFKSGKPAATFPVHDLDGNVEYYLEPPAEPQHLNAFGVRAAAAPGSYGDYLDTTPIACVAELERRLFVSAEGLVFPCCWTAQIYPYGPDANAEQLNELLAGLPDGKASIDARRHDIKEIVAGPFFRRIEESWSITGVANGRLRACARECGAATLRQDQLTASLI